MSATFYKIQLRFSKTKRLAGEKFEEMNLTGVNYKKITTLTKT